MVRDEGGWGRGGDRRSKQLELQMFDSLFDQALLQIFEMVSMAPVSPVFHSEVFIIIIFF